MDDPTRTASAALPVPDREAAPAAAPQGALPHTPAAREPALKARPSDRQFKAPHSQSCPASRFPRLTSDARPTMGLDNIFIGVDTALNCSAPGAPEVQYCIPHNGDGFIQLVFLMVVYGAQQPPGHGGSCVFGGFFPPSARRRAVSRAPRRPSRRPYPPRHPPLEQATSCTRPLI